LPTARRLRAPTLARTRGGRKSDPQRRVCSRHFRLITQTPKKAGFCYVVTVTLTDGSSLSGKIQLR